MKLYVTRHGQTDYNKNDIILGKTDLPLNETGLKQAEDVAKLLYSRNEKIDIVISSPMKRAYATAKAISEKCGTEIIIDEHLREWDYGGFEGKSRYTEGFAENKVNFGVRMGKTGESLLQLSHRVYSLLDEIKVKYSDKTVLLVCHGGVCRVIETYFNDLSNEQYLKWFMGNCQVLEYKL